MYFGGVIRNFGSEKDDKTPLCCISNPEMDGSSLLHHKALNNEPNSVVVFCFVLVVVELCEPPWREEYGRKNTKDIDWAPLSD